MIEMKTGQFGAKQLKLPKIGSKLVLCRECVYNVWIQETQRHSARQLCLRHLQHAFLREIAYFVHSVALGQISIKRGLSHQFGGVNITQKNTERSLKTQVTEDLRDKNPKKPLRRANQQQAEPCPDQGRVHTNATMKTQFRVQLQICLCLSFIFKRLIL